MINWQKSAHQKNVEGLRKMIITKGELVNGCYEAWLMISGLTAAAEPEEVTLALQQADDLANQLEADGLNLNWQNPSSYGYSDPADNSGLTAQMAGPFKTILSTYLLDAFGKQITANMADKAARAMRTLQQITVVAPDVQNPPTLPFGSGNEWDYNDRRFYGEPAKTNGAIYVYKGQTLNYLRDLTQNPNWLVDATIETAVWEVQDNGNVTIENIAINDTSTSADITFNETGGYTICIKLTKTDSNEVFIVNQNFVVQLCDDQGLAFTL